MFDDNDDAVDDDDHAVCVRMWCMIVMYADGVCLWCIIFNVWLWCMVLMLDDDDAVNDDDDGDVWLWCMTAFVWWCTIAKYDDYVWWWWQLWLWCIIAMYNCDV